MNEIRLESAEPEITADAVLDMVGLDETAGTTCALLTPTMRARLRALQPGQILEVRVDDPTAREDIASWCRLSGNTLLAVKEDGQALRFYVRKRD